MLSVTDVSFAPEVLDEQGLVLVDFWAPWCGPCKVLMPSLEKVAERYAGRVKVVKVNVDDESDIPAKYGIRGIPALLTFKGGKLVSQTTGAKTEGQLVQMFDKILAEHGSADPVVAVEEEDFLSGVVPQCPTDGTCEACQ